MLETKISFIKNDGGRAAAGYKGAAKDCVARAIAIATGKPYQNVCDDLELWAAKERISKRKKKRSTAQGGIYRATIYRYMAHLGWTWTPTMTIGSGCQVHLRESELPLGRLVVSVSRHLCAVIDGKLNDTHDCSRNGTRCVYGYWSKSKGHELAA